MPVGHIFISSRPDFLIHLKRSNCFGLGISLMDDFWVLRGVIMYLGLADLTFIHTYLTCRMISSTSIRHERPALP